MTRDQLIAEKNRELAWFKSRCADLELQLEAGRRFNYEKEARIAELEAKLNRLERLAEIPSIASFRLLSNEDKFHWFVVTGHRDKEQKKKVAELEGANGELACMVKVFQACIKTRTFPAVGSPCHQKVIELVGEDPYDD